MCLIKESKRGLLCWWSLILSFKYMEKEEEKKTAKETEKENKKKSVL